MDAASHLHQSDRVGVSVCRFLCALQAGWACTLCTSFCDLLPGRLRVSLLHSGRQLSRFGSGDRVSRQRCFHSVCTAVSSLLCALPVAATALPHSALARSLVVYSGFATARLFFRDFSEGRNGEGRFRLPEDSCFGTAYWTLLLAGRLSSRGRAGC